MFYNVLSEFHITINYWFLLYLLPLFPLSPTVQSSNTVDAVLHWTSLYLPYDQLSIPLFVTIQGTDLLCTTMLPSIFVILLIRVFWEFTYFKVHIWTQILDLFISSLIAFKEKLNYFQLFSVINENYNPLSMENGLVTAYSIPNEF